MQFSKRLDRFGDEVFASLNARRTELEAAGREVIDLSVGTPDFEPPACEECPHRGREGLQQLEVRLA